MTAGYQPPLLNVNGLFAVPTGQPPRVVYAGLAEDGGRQAITMCANTLSEWCHTAGLRVLPFDFSASGEYVPHLVSRFPVLCFPSCCCQFRLSFGPFLLPAGVCISLCFFVTHPIKIIGERSCEVCQH